MSDEEEEVSNQEEEEEEEENEEDEDEQGEEDQDQEDGDEDEDGDGSNQDEQEEEQQGGSDDGSKQQIEQPGDKLPKFRSIEPEEFKFTSLLSEIASLSNSVDHFINTLPSHGGSSHYRSYIPPPPRLPEVPLFLPKEQPPRVVVMKDEDTQVSMQPQIVIQPTRVEKPMQPSYKISNESSKFLAQLYEQNKKLKRWQNSSHSVNNHSATSAFYGSRERFERQEYEKGLFNVDERNREIDHAIQMLKRESDS